MLFFTLFLFCLLSSFHQSSAGCRCAKPLPESFKNSRILSPRPHEYISSDSLPQNFDWRNVNGTNYSTRVMTQQVPHVCGSCWAEAATGALSDRYNIATNNKLQIQLAPQNLLNFNEGITGGSCNGGDSLKAYEFIHTYGISDDTCAPFEGVDAPRGFEVNSIVNKEAVQNHMCFTCDWDGSCNYNSRDEFNLYGVDEYGIVTGVHEMKAEIYARGPIACYLTSEPDSFDKYTGGIIICDKSKEKKCNIKDIDHVIIIAGWGYDKETNQEFWVGRNSYGTRWGEGAGGGWFRLKLGEDQLNMESYGCAWATPAASDVARAIKQAQSAGYY